MAKRFRLSWFLGIHNDNVRDQPQDCQRTVSAKGTLLTSVLITSVLMVCAASNVYAQVWNGFGAAPSPTVSWPGAMAVGNFDGSGRQSIATCSYSANIVVLLSNGNGTFTNSVASPAANCTVLAAGDFNGDGKLDLVTNNLQTHTANILIGNGNGTFTTGASLALGTNYYASSIAVGDFNGDGKLDIAVGVESKVEIFLGRGNGTFTAGATYTSTATIYGIAVGDFNKDGHLDLAIAPYGGSAVNILLGTGTGTFTAAASPAASLIGYGIVAADFNGDGKLDLAVIAVGKVTIMLGNGNGTFAAGTSTSALADLLVGADFNGDGKADLVAVRTSVINNNVTVLLGNGDGTFTTSGSLYTTGSTPGHPVVGDWNGDGIPDLAISNSSVSNVTVLINLPIYTSLAASPNPGVYGQPLTLTATLVNHGTNSALPTGTVTFYSDGVSLGASSVSSNSASITTTALATGTHALTATYGGCTSYPGSNSNAVTETVNPAGQIISFPAPPSPVIYGVTPISLTATGGGSGNPIAFSVVSGPGSINGTTLTITGAGSVVIAANQAGNTYYTAAPQATNSILVNKATPTINVITSGSPSTYGGLVTFTATVSSGPTGTVSFYNGGKPIGTGNISGTAATFATSSLADGSNSITAGWPGNANYNAVTSSAIIQTVNAQYTPTVTLVASPSQVMVGTFAVFTATINGGSNPSGTVTFQVNGTVFGTAQVINGLATYNGTNENWAPGIYTVSAIYSGDNYNNSATGAATEIVLAPKDSGTITLTVNGVLSASTTYGAASTPSTIATGLAAGVTAASPVNISAVDNELYLQSKLTGSATNYFYSLQTTSYDTIDFSSPSFMNPPANGSLEGGSDQTSAGNRPIYNFTASYDSASNLQNYSDSVMGNWSYSYDSLNRLTGASDTQPGNPNGFYCWGYDSFGNRTLQIGTTAPFVAGSPTCQTAPDASATSTWANFNTNNQFTNNVQAVSGVSYDAAGNVTADGAKQYLYDGDGRICAVASWPSAGLTPMIGYIYDTEGRRVAKGSIAAWSCDPSVNGFTTANDYVLGSAGEQLTEMAMNSNGSMAWQHTNVYAAGQLLATYDQNGLHFHLNDPLGTRRVQTDYAGVVEQTCNSLPYGDSLACTGSIQFPTELHFTGKERDTESGNDYFGARYYASNVGRFMTPDWSDDSDPIPYADLGNPQTLNMYGYVGNNPLGHVDLLGHSPDVGRTFAMDADLFLMGLEEDPLNNSKKQGPIPVPPQPPVNVDGGYLPPLQHIPLKVLVGMIQVVNSRLIFQRGNGGQGKGERGQTAKPDKPAKGAKPKRDKNGNIVGWRLPTPDGKGVDKSVDWGRANGLDPANYQTATQIGVWGAVAAGGAYILSNSEWVIPFLF